MNSIERFQNTVQRKSVDRPACWLGLPDASAFNGLFSYFGVTDMTALKRQMDDDIFSVEIPYHSQTSNAIYAAFDFADDRNDTTTDKRTLTKPGFFTDCGSLERVEAFDWPDPERYISISECKRLFDSLPKDKAIMGILWSAHFQDSCAAFGMENAFMTMLTNPEIYEAVNDKIVAFYLKANQIFYEAAQGKLHAVLIGNDMGGQNELMLSPEMIRRFVIPGAKKLIQQAKSYGLIVVYHSCGAIFEVIPDLIEAGVDVIHPIQALAKGMSPDLLKETYGDKVSFCGGVDTQDLLVNGSTKDVSQKVHELKMLFETGLIISPSHEAVLSDVKPENIAEIFNEVKRQHEQDDTL